MVRSSTTISLFALALLTTLTVGCGDDSGGGTTYVLGECIDDGDGFLTCDDYCLDTFGAMARSGVDLDGAAEGDACEIDFRRPAAGASAGYSTLTDCQNDGEAISVGSSGSSDLSGSSRSLTVRCCCALNLSVNWGRFVTTAR